MVVNIRTGADYDVYVGRGRGSRWGNPFRIGPDGTRQEVVEKYADWLWHDNDPRAQWIRDHVHELHGKKLGCWCAPELCHADILVQLAND